VGLYFLWDAFDVEMMVGEKIITSSFGGAVQDVSQAHAPK
jgi:hypothetical protein